MALDVELAEVRDFLGEHHPFSEIPREEREALVSELAVEYFRRGTAIMAPGRENHLLYIVRSGAVDIRDSVGTLVDRGGVGSCFGSTTLVGGNPSDFSVVAIEDVLTLVMPAATFIRLCRDYPQVDEFFDDQRSRRIAGAVATQQVSFHGSAILKTSTADLGRRPPVTVPVGTTIRQAAQTMSQEGVSSLLVMDGDRLAGLVTDRDLRNRVVAAGVDPARPITEIMTPDPVTASTDGMAFDVLLEMVANRIHHLPLVKDGRPVGVVTITDLMRLERHNPVYLAGDIAKQRDPAGVAAVARRLPLVVEDLVAQDASADDMGRIVTSIGDALERRLVALAIERLGAPPAPYCWVTLGSRARMEQALAADQDNALILADGIGQDERDYFSRLAELVCGWLVDAGYPPCPGGIMATNPQWRIPLGQWRNVFRTWIQQPDPEAILRASIFFDMRPVAGDPGLYTTLADEVRTQAPGSRRFLAQLAKSAVANEPPIGFFRGFVLAKEGEHKDSLDIKRGGIGAVVDLARVHALAIGATATHTDKRLAEAIEARVIDRARGEDLRDAFEYISYVRFRHQAAAVRAGRAPDNFVQPDDLSSFDKRHLREAFAIVRSAQSTLGSIHSTGALG